MFHRETRKTDRINKMNKIGYSEHSENSVHCVENNLRKSGAEGLLPPGGELDRRADRDAGQSGDCESTVDELSDAARFLIEDGYRAVIGGLRIAV
jgi:hypothetical protein